MGIAGYSFLIGLTLIPISFLFLPKLYFDKRFVIPLYILTIVLACIGWTREHQDTAKPNFHLFLLCPFFSLLLLRLELYIFIRNKGRYPVYPPRNWFGTEDGLWADRFFYFTFMTLSLCVPLLILAVSYP